jgi:acetyltransferase-like isoleucine patch superfamily enzyme
VRLIDREHMGGAFVHGDGCKIADSADIDTSADVRLGSRVAISEDVLILTHDHDTADRTRVHASPLTIGDNAWVGARVIILASCSSIGERAVIGAGAVVTHDVPAREIWAGVPARRIGVVE